MSKNAFLKKARRCCRTCSKRCWIDGPCTDRSEAYIHYCERRERENALIHNCFHQFANCDGYVQGISADVIKASKSDMPFYLVRLSIKRHSPGAAHDLTRLKSGMAIDFYILSGKRTVLDYIDQPVARVQKRAFGNWTVRMAKTGIRLDLHAPSWSSSSLIEPFLLKRKAQLAGKTRVTTCLV